VPRGDVFHIGPFVKLGDRDFDTDLGHPRNVAVGQGGGGPEIAGIAPGMNREANARVFEDDIAADGRDGVVFAELVDPVGAARGWAEDFEDHDDPGYEAGGPGSLGAGDEGIRIAHGVADGSDAGGGAERTAIGTLQTNAQGGVDIPHI
jgi:hypothetical protein